MEIDYHITQKPKEMHKRKNSEEGVQIVQFAGSNGKKTIIYKRSY